MAPLESDTAQEYADVRRTYRLQGGGDVLVGPAPGYLRHAICATADRQNRGGAFESRYWNVTSPKRSGPVDVDWCGIYATWVWLQAQLQVEWAFVSDPPNTPRDKRGINNGPYKNGSHDRIKTSTRKDLIAPGDIVVQARPFHHLLVLSLSADGQLAEVLEGNAGAGPKTQTIVRRRDGYPLGQVAYFYSVDSYRWPGVNHGQNFGGRRP